MTSMTKRLAQLESLNKSLRSEMAELRDKNFALSEQNQTLRLLTSEEAEQALTDLVKEKNALKKENEEMHKFLKDYGLKWVGGEGGQHEGVFDKEAIKEELKFNGPAFRNNLPKEIDTEVLTRRIEELNFMTNSQGHNPLTYAASLKNFDLVNYLTGRGMLIDVEDREGKTILLRALES